MVWLILGVLLWALTHSIRHSAPGFRAGLGENGAKMFVLATTVVAVVLMVIGYRSADAVPYYVLGGWAKHLNNLLMVIAVILMMSGHSKSRIRGLMRHPMLTGLIVWAVAHLLVNGDLPSLVLFGGLALWAVYTIAATNRAEPDHTAFGGGSLPGDLRLLGISAAVFVVIVLVHGWVGPSPFMAG